MIRVIAAVLALCVASWVIFGFGGAGAQPNDQKKPLDQNRPHDQNRPNNQKELSPSEAVKQVLQLCHGTLRSATGMAHATVNLFHSGDRDDEENFDKDTIVLAANPLMRVRRTDASTELHRPDGMWRQEEHKGPWIEVVDKEQVAESSRFQALIRASLLEPIYEAKTVERVGPHEFTLKTTRDETWQLMLKSFQPEEGEALLLPASLAGPHGTVEFVKYNLVGITNLPYTVRLGEFGTWPCRLENSGITWEEPVFAKPK